MKRSPHVISLSEPLLAPGLSPGLSFSFVSVDPVPPTLALIPSSFYSPWGFCLVSFESSWVPDYRAPSELGTYLQAKQSLKNSQVQRLFSSCSPSSQGPVCLLWRSRHSSAAPLLCFACRTVVGQVQVLKCQWFVATDSCLGFMNILCQLSFL